MYAEGAKINDLRSTRFDDARKGSVFALEQADAPTSIEVQAFIFWEYLHNITDLIK